MLEQKGKSNENWFVRHKVWTALLVLLALGFIQNLFGKGVTSNTQTTVTPTASVTKPVIKRNIVVTSEIVKRVAPNTYRYFFNIANQDTSDFNGEVSVQLFNGHDNPQPLVFGGARKNFTIQAGANGTTYVDDSHAPSRVNGIDGATTFSYTASIGDSDVATGKDSISNQYEDYTQQ